ncbi:hypothetical protein GCM10022393_33520 [Aquimarina addita]|uniref:Adenylosuccinate lyase n=1 Tax=Aquimarina addita TaxID=870485 RepID=A0ABP6UPF5_9FLAO
MIDLVNEIKKVNHSQEKRNNFTSLLVEHPDLLPELISICAQVDKEISCRASWGLEFLCRHDIKTILPHLDAIIAILPVVYQHPAVRPMAKICEYLIFSYYKTRSSTTRKQLHQIHREKITEACFDWLISDQKVATKAYAMTSLYQLGTEFTWIHPELKIILEKDYPKNSAAYKARARMILKKLAH